MSSDVQAQLDVAWQLLAAGGVDGAGSMLGALIEAHGDPTAHHLRGAIEFMDDRLDDAVPVLGGGVPGLSRSR